jgi:tripartite-type tricarboxylate transporter receptor subunit TctC
MTVHKDSSHYQSSSRTAAPAGGRQLFKTSVGIDITVVTYRNPPEMVTALLRNDVDAVLDSFTVFNSGLQAGIVRALATTGANRSAVLPDVPTVQESGLKDFEVTSWNGWFAAAGTPPAAIGRLNKELNVVMALPGLRQKLLAMGFEAHAGTPQELHERLKADIKRWATVIARAGIEKR